MSTHHLNHSRTTWVLPAEQNPGEPEPETTPALVPELLPLANEVAVACQRYQQLFDQRTQRWEASDLSSPSSEPLQPESVEGPLEDLALLRRLAQAVAKQPEQLAALEAHCDWTLFDWISDRIFSAAEQGQLETALGLFADWEKVTGEQTEDLVGTRERLLLCGGRIEEAKATVQQRLERQPESLDALESAAFIYQQSGDLEAAEKYARRYLAVARQTGDTTDEICALQTLAEVLHERGDHDAATEFEQEAASLPLGELEDESPEGPTATSRTYSV